MVTTETLTYSIWHIVVANVGMLLLLSFFIYKTSKDKAFLLYGLYNLFLLGYLFLKNDYITPPALFQRILPLNWGIQIIYNVFLSYFGISFC